ncbi:MAG: hypothetical protein ABW164_04005 [Sphingobium sp.]
MLQSFLLLLAVPADEPVQWAQLAIQRRVIIRVPMARKGKMAARIAPDERGAWREKKGPRCIALRSIRSAAIVAPDGVDLILSDDHRYRAELGRGCASAGFYSGFYVEPDDDGSLCSGRDELQARSGIACAISGFKRLVAVKRDD